MVDETEDVEPPDGDHDELDAPRRREDLLARIDTLETELSALRVELVGLEDEVEEKEELPADEEDSNR